MVVGGWGWTSNTPGHLHTSPRFCRDHGDVTHGGLGGFVSCPYSFHITACLIGFPLEEGCSLIFLFGNKNTWERPEVRFLLFVYCCLFWIVKSRPKDKSVYYVVYCESRKREVKTKPIYECRCDERLKTKTEKSTRLAYTWKMYTLGYICAAQKKKRLLRVFFF